MQISHTNINSLGSGSADSVAGSQVDARSSAAVAKTKPDSVSLSDATNLVALAKASAASRQTKIDSLSEQIQSGAYQSDTAQISHAVVQGHITA